MKTEKKAQSLTIGQLITLAIVVVIVAIVSYCLIAGTCNAAINKINIFFPDYKLPTGTVTETQIVVYDVAADKLQYWDGNQLVEADREIVYNDKIVETNAGFYFASYYYGRTLPNSFTLSEEKRRETDADGNILRLYNPKFTIESFGVEDKGKMRVRVQYADYQASGADQGYYGYFVIASDNKLSKTSREDIFDIRKSIKILGQSVPGKNLNKGLPIYAETRLTSLRQETKNHLENINNKNEQEIKEKGYELKSYSQHPDAEVYNLQFNQQPTELYIISYVEKDQDNKIINEIRSTIGIELGISSVLSEVNAIGVPEREIISQTSKWRDSVLANPMPIKLKGDANFRYFCVRKETTSAKVLLTIDLTKPVNETTRC